MLKLGFISDNLKISAFDLNEDFDKSEFKFNEYKAGLNFSSNGLDIFLDECDIISLDIINEETFYLAQKIIRNSKHLYVSDIKFLDYNKANELLKLSLEADVKLQIARPNRFKSILIEAYNHLNNPLYIESHKYVINNNINSIVKDIMLDDIDNILHIVNSPVKNIFASGIDILFDKASVINARIEFANSCVANITAGNMSENEEYTFKLLQNGGSISINYLENKIEILKSIKDNNGNNEVKTERIELKEKNSQTEDFKYFINAVVNNSSLENSISNYMKAMEVAEEICDKIR